jgi:type IV pilus assembly protein PilY1
MRSLRTLVCLGAVLLGVSTSALAQDPDVRDIPPLVMLVVDTSGSMEELPACTCTSPTDCTNCEVHCELPNVFTEPPAKKKNRWAVTLEALTGKFKDFQCEPLTRDTSNGFSGWYDENYPIPYHQPWKCSTGTRCDYPGPSIQETNGILDNYRDTLRFGLVTFDGEYTYKGASPLINSTNFNDTLSNGMPGMWSYGDKKEVKYYGCPETYLVNSGARSQTATEGALVSIDCKTPPCADIYTSNDKIQDALLRARPYGGTPIAASLDDLYDHLKKDVVDDFVTCRKRYAILITDGAPDVDFRDLRCQCGDEDKMVACEDGSDGSAYTCPYPTAPTAAKKLVSGLGSEPKQLDQLFVLGMSVSDKDAIATLDDIALAGGTTKALAADDPNTLRATLDNVFGPLLNPISRSVPAFATGINGTQYQISTGFRVSSSSTSSVAPPWIGLIERRQFTCTGAGELESPDIKDADRFHLVLAGQVAEGLEKRQLQTAIPPGGATFDSNILSGALVKGDGSTDYCQKGCDLIDLNDTKISAPILSETTASERQSVLDWMYAVSGSPRAGRPLGDIYHGSPTLVGAPKDEPADDAYTTFRDRPEVKERPLMMYITTNDGILHAISVEDYPPTGFTLSTHLGDKRLPLTAGRELWGFVPPMLLKDLKNQMSAHQFNLDGTPVVKDVFFKRGTSAAETEYHSVLITGMRAGGHGYLALDVTDPLAPKFLWQFTDKDMGLTYGQPEIVQATFKFAATSSETPTVQTRAVAILSGGVGRKKSSTSTDAIGCVSGQTPAMLKSGEVYTSYITDPMLPKGGGATAPYRDAVQCWERQGRALYFVDVETGQLIKKVFDEDTDATNGIMFPSPVVGTPTAYQDAVATIADRGFVIDADGVIWRIDMSAQDPMKDEGMKGWTVRPFHDLYWDKIKDPAGGETTYERPILSLDRTRRLVVIVGTGDTDNFEKKTADNRIVSLTELTTVDSATQPDDYKALINWELRNEGFAGNALVPSEMVTGAMALFEGQLFAATFISDVGSGDSCEYGRGRLWSLDYITPDEKHDNHTDMGSGAATGTKAPMLIPVVAESGSTEDSETALFNIDLAHARKNLLVQGLGTTQRPTCTPPADPLLSYFSPGLASIEQTEPPAIWVVAQASQGGKRAGSTLGSVQTKVKRPITFSRVTSWAASID